MTNIPCCGQFTTGAEVHNCMQEKKPDIASCYQESEFHYKEDLEKDQVCSELFPVIQGAKKGSIR